MKIAVPVDEKNLDSAVCVSFGRAPYFMFYHTENQEVTFIENRAVNAQGGAGIKAAQVIVDGQADVLLTVRCGENAAEVLKTAEIKIYKTTEATVKENLEAFKSGKLAPMTQFHAGFHGKQ